MGPPKTGPHGLSSYDDELRRLSEQGRFDEALTVAEEEADAAGDEVLAALNRAIVEHYAGRYEESNELLQAAELEIEERFTKSVSRAALSLVTNDRALAWLPSRAERPMVHVYGALNYLALGEPDEAAVEARRLARVLDGMVDEDGAEALDAETRQLYRSLRYFTGAVFEQAGERNDADVAYRLAGVGAARDSGSDFADTTEHVSAETSGVVVLVESGFVAHRVERSVHLLVGADELDDLRYGSESRRLRFARCFSQRRLDHPMNAWGASHDDWCDGIRYSSSGGRKKGDKDDDVTYLMRVAWPTMYRPLSAAPVGPVRAFSGSGAGGVPTITAARDATALGSLPLDAVAASPEGEGAGDASGLAPPETPGSPVVSADLSGAVIRDFNRQAPEMLVKSVARAAVKYAVVQAIEDGARKEDETLADVVAVVGNALAALTERADTRSWTLLPAQIQIVRLPLPPGRHEVRVAAEGASGATLDLGEVEVRPGRVTVVSTRAWP
ncbi:MAG TPA: hypothetical protein VLA33_10035 [Gemmatimonadota bacterium]|nr:hypothetical protein [Gemmatimonadota bacterium]